MEVAFSFARPETSALRHTTMPAPEVPLSVLSQRYYFLARQREERASADVELSTVEEADRLLAQLEDRDADTDPDL